MHPWLTFQRFTANGNRKTIPVAIKGGIKICVSGMRCPNEAAFGVRNQTKECCLVLSPIGIIPGGFITMWYLRYGKMIIHTNAKLYLLSMLHYFWRSLLGGSVFECLLDGIIYPYHLSAESKQLTSEYLLATSGMINFSYCSPVCVLHPATRLTGASNRRNAPSWIVAATSAPTP